MDPLKKTYFDAIASQRRKALEFYHSPMDKGVFEIIQNLYKDKAHFVYELLQNADDQGATTARFVLSHDCLLFAHNAPRHFTISNPATHEEDRKAGRLGDINSIVSIGSSAKRGRDEERVPIGKFGIGFKSVFQYTTRPEIYDDGVRFSIMDYILPVLLDEDHPERKAGETLFLFPFDKENKDCAYGEIADTLKRLAEVKPLLFLNSLNRIDWNDEGSSGSYTLKSIGKKGSGDSIQYETIIGDERTAVHFWKFERQLEDKPNLKVAVVYTIDDETHRIADSYSYNLYCYLPTTDKCPVPAILHAPFQLSNNRESIEVNDGHNLRMINMLASLLAESLEEICRIGQEEGTPWIDDNIASFLPSGEDYETFGTTASLDLTGLSESVLEAVRRGKMLWCVQREAYLNIEQGVLPDAEYLPDIYPSKILSELFDKELGWVLTSLKTRYKTDARLVKALGIKSMTNKKILDEVSPEFLARRTEEWLLRWYPRLLEVKNLWPELKYKEIILTSDGTFRAPYIAGKTDANVHLPNDEGNSLRDSGLVSFVAEKMLENEGCMAFFRGIGLTIVSHMTMAGSVYLPQALNGEIDASTRLK